MNAATRQALQRKKKELAAGRVNATSIDVIELRAATKQKLAELLERSPKKAHDLVAPMKLATAIESTLQKDHKAPSGAYKSAFRRLYTCLKNEKAPLRDQLRLGELSPDTFARMSTEELKSEEQRHTDKDLIEKSMKNSVGQQLLPENVNQIKDGRDREKWGVSRSAAAIDDD